MILREVGELLAQFAQSDWRDLYVRTPQFTLFLAKPQGGPNPLIDTGSTVAASPGTAAAGTGSSQPSGGESTASTAGPKPPASDVAGSVILAPHVGTVAWLAQSGTDIAPGAVVAKLAVLEELVEVRSELSGRVTAVLSQDGTLVEYDSPLVEMSPNG